MNVHPSDFKNYRLRKIIKENHGKIISSLNIGLKNLNQQELDLSHLLLTSGDKQINIYDNEHYGEHLDLMCHFTLDKQDNIGNINTACFIRKKNDSLVAFAGDSGIIHIISLAHSQEIFRLDGHQDCITKLIAHPIHNHLLLSISKDRTMKVWDLKLRKEIGLLNFDVTAASFNEKGSKILIGTRQGNIKFVRLPSMLFNKNDIKLTISKSNDLLNPKHHGDCIDQILIYQDKILSKSKNGIIILWCPKTLNIEWRIKFKDIGSNLCSDLDISDDNNYFTIGGNSGTIYVYSLKDGKLLFEDRHRRSTKPIVACKFAKKDRNIIFTSGDSLIWRYDYIDDKTLQSWKDWSNGLDDK